MDSKILKQMQRKIRLEIAIEKTRQFITKVITLGEKKKHKIKGIKLWHYKK